jgi:hypothetical protein
MTPPDELLQSRSRAKYRKLAWEAAIACALLAVCYEVVAVLGRQPVPFIICLIAAGVFAFIGYALPDRRPRSDEMREYEEGRNGTVRDGRPPSPSLPPKRGERRQG